jgi:hypothetical protein
MILNSISDLEVLRYTYGENKQIPKKYEHEILTALSHYPELKNVNIRFELTSRAAVPYGTKPSLASCFLPRHKRVYTITILEEARGPMASALIKNVTHDMRIGIIGHELCHVVQYNCRSCAALLKMIALYPLPFFKKKIEQGADRCAIMHGLGHELLLHAMYIRQIPGYTEQRPEINKYYLKPAEIKDLLAGADNY